MGIEFERRKGETTVIQLEDGNEIEFTITGLTGTIANISVEPKDKVKRVLKLEIKATE